MSLIEAMLPAIPWPMALNWNEIRAKASAFSERHKLARYEKGETQTFYNEFFSCFGVDRKLVATYEQRVKNLPGDRQGFIDLFMPGKLIIEQKSAGLDLRKASNQALNYYEWLPAPERPRYILTCDFQRWNLLDLENGRELRFLLPELKKHVTQFAFIAGTEVREYRNQKPVNPKATTLLAAIHNRLEEDGYTGHKLQLLLVRILFMLFADATNIWQKQQLLRDLHSRTREDGSDLGSFLTQLFETLNTDKPYRQASLPEHFRHYPYINGRLFAESIGTATFNAKLRGTLINAFEFDWGTVSPAIFGALFEGVIDKITRRKKGAHYTPEDAIYRLLGPLFLDDLHAEFEGIKARSDGGKQRALSAFHEKLVDLHFFDPACGAGNFLVVTYRELRDLERQVLEELYPPETRLAFGANEISKMKVDQFYGIEIDEFPSQIAQVALWMTDHIANVILGEVYGAEIPSIPLVHAPTIIHGDALQLDWGTVIEPEKCSYILGNPPFIGAKMQSEEQRAQVRRIANLKGSGGTLDYVAAWFLKAAQFVQGGEGRFAFVSTNSITQGEQVAQVWPKIFGEYRMEIAFGHRTFVWPGKAAVHCVIVGLAKRGAEPARKRLFSYPDPSGKPVETQHDWLVAYLFPAPPNMQHVVVKEENKPVNGAIPIVIGSKPIDGGWLILNAEERENLLRNEPAAARFIRPYIGTEEYLYGGMRWILTLQDASASDLRALPLVSERVRKVKAYRKGDIPAKGKTKKTDRGQSSTALADTPTAFHVTVIPKSSFLAVPEVSSEKREYIPIGWLQPPVVPSNLVKVIVGADIYQFAILTSRMHMAWMANIGGRLESRYRYSIGLVYNNFPWPSVDTAKRARIEALGQAVLDARALAKNSTSALADLYDPDFMPIELRKSHRELDAAVDKLYAVKGFDNDLARVSHLFKLYEQMVMPTAGAAAANRKTLRRVRVSAK